MLFIQIQDKKKRYISEKCFSMKLAAYSAKESIDFVMHNTNV